MSVIPEEVFSAAEAAFDKIRLLASVQGTGWGHEAIEWDSLAIARIIAEALMAERDAQRERVVKMLVGIADVLAGHMVNQATPELLKTLADAVLAFDLPDEAEPK